MNTDLKCKRWVVVLFYECELHKILLNLQTTQARPRLSIDSRQTSVTSGGTPAANPQQGQGHAAPTTDLLSSIGKDRLTDRVKFVN